MKKIFAVALVALAVAGASAQVSTSMNIMSQVNIANITIYSGDKPSWAEDSYKFLMQHVSADRWYGSTVPVPNAVGFSASTEHAGVEFSLLLNPLRGPYSMVGGSPAYNRQFDIGTLTGWFGIGGFKLTATNGGIYFTDRLDQDYEMTNRLSFLGERLPYRHTLDDYANMGAGYDAQWATVADYTFDLDFATLMVRGALFNPPRDADHDHLASGFGFEAGVALRDNLLTVDLIAKFPLTTLKREQHYAAYLHMRPWTTLMFTVGGAFALQETYDSEFSIDARVRWMPLDALSVTVYGNFYRSRFSRDEYNLRPSVVANVTWRVSDALALFVEGVWRDWSMSYDTQYEAQLGLVVSPVENVRLAMSAQVEWGRAYLDTYYRTYFSVPIALNVAF